MDKPECVVVDWGTSSFRLWVLDDKGDILKETSKKAGMSTLEPHQFAPTLDEQLDIFKVDISVPVVICGMAGAVHGWIEAPYIDLPASLMMLPQRAISAPGSARKVFILPGLAQRKFDRPNVMRGEETLLLGALLDQNTSGIICMPGTHSKWVTLEKDKITSFETAMTGEVFSLLSEKSTLSPFAFRPGMGIKCNQTFEESVREGLNFPQRTLQSIFSVRSKPLLMGKEYAIDMPERLSGLLIGLEISGAMIDKRKAVTLISSGPLTDVYNKALSISGHSIVNLDAEKMSRIGLFHCAKEIIFEINLSQGD